MEGPSLVILTEELEGFHKKKILKVSGNTTAEKERLLNKKLVSIMSWGKHLLLQFDDFYLRIHFLMYGSYRINESKPDKPARLSLGFRTGEINFYNCSVRLEEGQATDVYDWSADTMSEAWDEKKALKKISEGENMQVCDVLMNQEIFAGVGNIIKNEVFYLEHLDPRQPVHGLSPARLRSLVRSTREYCSRFYEWKKVYQLKKHWQIFRKRKCPRCNIPVVIEKTGKLQRLSYYCTSCQELKIKPAEKNKNPGIAPLK